MVVLDDSPQTAIDIATHLPQPQQKYKKPVMKLAQQNPLYAHLISQPTTHLMSTTSMVNTALPQPSLTGLNEAVRASKALFDPQTDTCSVLEVCSVLDDRHEMYSVEDKAALNAARARMAGPFLEGLAQEQARLMLYGNPAGGNDKEISGFINRLNSLSMNNVHDCGGTGNDLSSILIVATKEDCCHAIHPRMSTAGMIQKDRGVQQVHIPASEGGGHYYGYVEQFYLAVGIHLPHEEYVQRVCNIESQDVLDIAGTQLFTAYGTNILNKVLLGLTRIPDSTGSRIMILMPRLIFGGFVSMVDSQARSNGFTMKQIAGGGMIGDYKGVPVMPMDQLHNAEQQVV